ncbi:MAG: response regulator transcription factor [Anaerolineae bacterium]
MHSLLLVEDDLSLIEGLRYALEKAGYRVDVARTVRGALDAALTGSHDLLILDLALPDGSGMDVCRRVRQSSAVPIVFLTASDEEVSVVMGLDLGADDYITKPFRLNELLSRIRALLRRAGIAETAPTLLTSNGLTVRLAEGRVYRGGSEIELTPAEYRLLCVLMGNPDRLLARDALLRQLWDNRVEDAEGAFVDDNTLSVYVRRLRSKIEDDPSNPRYLQTVRGLGYRWNVSE